MALPGAALYGKNLAACRQLLQAEVLFDAIHETGAQLLLLAVHRKNRHLRAESNNEMAAVSRLECAALLLQPSPEFLTRHIITNGRYNSCVALSTDVLCRTLELALPFSSWTWPNEYGVLPEIARQVREFRWRRLANLGLGHRAQMLQVGSAATGSARLARRQPTATTAHRSPPVHDYYHI